MIKLFLSNFLRYAPPSYLDSSTAHHLSAHTIKLMRQKIIRNKEIHIWLCENKIFSCLLIYKSLSILDTIIITKIFLFVNSIPPSINHFRDLINNR